MSTAIERIFREEFGRVVASLTRRFGDLDVAEEAAGEALLAALERWPVDGVPPNPGGWLTTTATRRALDRIRREQQRDVKHRAAQMIHDDTPHEPTGVVDDDRLRLIFTCCHPALAPEARVALTLRLLGGLTVAEIAAAFLVPETTMAQRITRAKAKIKGARIPYRVPSADDLGERLAAVLTVVYLVFNEGYLASAGDAPVRAELTGRGDPARPGAARPAARRARGRGAARAHAADRSPPAQPGGRWGARAAAGAGPRRVGPRADHRGPRAGPGVPRPGPAHRPPPGRHQLLAAVNAVHTDAPSWADTDWRQIAALYDQLAAVDPGPVVALNRAVAVAELDGPAVGLAVVDRLALTGYHAWHATRADLLRRLGRSAEARAAYDAAIAATDNPAERAFLTRRRGQLAG